MRHDTTCYFRLHCFWQRLQSPWQLPHLPFLIATMAQQIAQAIHTKSSQSQMDISLPPYVMLFYVIFCSHVRDYTNT